MEPHLPPHSSQIVTTDEVLEAIRPGMRIFLGTGAAEPRTLVKRLMTSDKSNLEDLELIQLISLGDAISIEKRYSHRYRLKTFFAGWVASEGITTGLVDLIPCRFSRVPELIASGSIQVDAAFVQVTPPDEAGYSSLGVAVDTARQAMERARLVVGEINEQVPRTFGDTFVHVKDFHFLIKASEPPIYFPRWPVDDVYDRVAENIASIIPDNSCLGYSIGPLYEALARHLTGKKNLGIHGLIFTDALMDLVKSGAVSNRRKATFRGKCLVSYAMGTPELMHWLDQNPLVEFQGIDKVTDPRSIGLNDNFIAILPARKVDLTGRVALHAGKGAVSASPGEAHEFFVGSQFSRGGKTVFALPSRNLSGQSNILLSLKDYPNQFDVREFLDMVVSEYGVAAMTGRTVRDRALSLIDIAHPEDRAELVRQARDAGLLYRDQIYFLESGHLYPQDLSCTKTFKNSVTIRFRPIKPSDEEEMRRLFYRFSKEAVYYRYFSPLRSMPHARMQEYVNIDYRRTFSLVGLSGESGAEKIIAEARYVTLPESAYGDLALVVDEAYQGKGIATFLLEFLIQMARKQGLQGFTADVLHENKAMWRVLQKSGFPLQVIREANFYHVTIPFTRNGSKKGVEQGARTWIPEG